MTCDPVIRSWNSPSSLSSMISRVTVSLRLTVQLVTPQPLSPSHTNSDHSCMSGLSCYVVTHLSLHYYHGVMSNSITMQAQRHSDQLLWMIVQKELGISFRVQSSWVQGLQLFRITLIGLLYDDLGRGVVLSPSPLELNTHAAVG